MKNHLNKTVAKTRRAMDRTTATKTTGPAGGDPYAALDFEPSPTLLRRARAVAREYTVVIEPEQNPDEGFRARVREFPGIITGGETFESCAHNVTFAMETAVAIYLAEGRSPPRPLGHERRSEEVKVRLTPSEHNALTRESRRRGFRGLADFIRARVVDAGNVASIAAAPAERPQRHPRRAS